MNKTIYVHAIVKDSKDRIIEELKVEKKLILKENKQLKEKIDRAIEKIYKIIESNNSALSNPEYTIVNKHKLIELNNNECKKLLKLLGDKE